MNASHFLASRCGLLLALCLSLPQLSLLGQQGPKVDVVLDLLEAFSAAQVTDSSSSQVRRPAVAGGVKQNALFEHPAPGGRPARIRYEVSLPPATSHDRLLLAFDIALADGIKFGQGADGVRFVVEIEGRAVFSQEAHECRWQSHALDLTALAGRRIQLTLITDAIGNTSYDWAVWGNPRLLHFRGLEELRPNSPGQVSFSIASGALAIAYPNETSFKFRLKPGDGILSTEWSSPLSKSPSKKTAWAVLDFNHPASTSISLEWEPKEAAVQIYAAAYPARPKLVQVSPTRALISTGDQVPLRVEVKNEGRGKLTGKESRIQLDAGDEAVTAQFIPALAPGETWRGEWNWKAPTRAGAISLKARLTHGDGSEERAEPVEIFPPATPSDIASIENEYVRLDFVRHPETGGYAYARVYSKQQGGWAPAAVWRPLFQIILDHKAGEKVCNPRPRQAQKLANHPAQTIEFTDSLADPEGIPWELKLTVALEPGRPSARIHYEWQASQARDIKALWGPNLYVGDGATGEAKTSGLFPGLEYLYGPERSSNPRDFHPPLDDRRTPHPHKITVPLMAVTVGPRNPPPPDKPSRFFAPDSLKDEVRLDPQDFKSQISNLKSPLTVALLWDPQQRWDGQHTFPSARFSSPNLDQGMRNHRLGLFLPSAPEFVSENADRAEKPYSLPAGRRVTLDAKLVAAPEPVNAALREWLREVQGLPQPNAWPRSFQQELDICRAGFLKTVWDQQTEKWRHCIGWAPSQAPGFAALLWLDSQLTEKPEAKTDSRDRVELAVKNMLRDGGPRSFMSQANCHIMQWEFPFLYGYLSESMAGLEGVVQQLMRSQRPDGGWVYQPANAEQADLGQAGDSVLGTCANRAATLLRYARITGDTAALAAGEKALHFMERFRVPRGGQTWECPMYEPDILAAAYAIRAYHDAFRVTGNTRWLHDAVYWAETGVPFIYLWSLANRPMMLGSTIPVFGSTFYTHTWLAVPVQWCGLVYAYHVFHLAEELERARLAQTDSPLPLSLHFAPADWKRIVELITVSAMYQQFGEGERIGSYPDSIAGFEQRNPAFINPEDILVNVLALKGHDADVKTARLRTDHGDITISSGASIQKAEATTSGIRFQLAFFAGEASHSLIAGLKPKEVTVENVLLPQSSSPVRRAAGWWWDEQHKRAYLVVPQTQSVATVQIKAE